MPVMKSSMITARETHEKEKTFAVFRLIRVFRGHKFLKLF